MIGNVLRGSTALAGGVGLALAFTVMVAAQETPAPAPAPPTTPAQGEVGQAVPTAASPARLAGQWHFNKELSTPPPAPGDDSGQGGGQPAGGGGGGGYGGGRGGRGGGGGGGYGGGRGGRGGGGMGGGGQQMSSGDVLKARELMRSLREPADVLNIVIHTDDVTMTDDQGVVHTYKTNGKKESVDFGTAKIDTITKWDADALTQALSVGSTKVSVTYQVTTQGNMMAVTIQPTNPANNGNGSSSSSNGRGQFAPMKYIYDRAEQ